MQLLWYSYLLKSRLFSILIALFFLFSYPDESAPMNLSPVTSTIFFVVEFVIHPDPHICSVSLAFFPDTSRSEFFFFLHRRLPWYPFPITQLRVSVFSLPPPPFTKFFLCSRGLLPLTGTPYSPLLHLKATFTRAPFFVNVTPLFPPFLFPCPFSLSLTCLPW